MSVLVRQRRGMLGAAAVLLAVGGWWLGKQWRGVKAAPLLADAREESLVENSAPVEVSKAYSRRRASGQSVAGRPAPEQAPYRPSAPSDRFHPRDPNEWQGMLVNVANFQVCTRSGSCGLGLACIERRCGPCSLDAECAEGEACVLDRCLREGNVGCRSRRDCGHLGEDALCILSGLTAHDPRSNAELRSYCNPGHGGTSQDVNDPEAIERMRLRTSAEHIKPPISAKDLFRKLDLERARRDTRERASPNPK
ncbi:MAG: hypothetical protein MJD61_09175 [Proteobacteria bacterium]|nr:hypothetical protein [Pseudomonadota bacterium]